MKNWGFLYYVVVVLTIISFMTLSGCQEPVFEIQEPPPEEAFKGNSQVAGLLQRTSLNDGSPDNIIDHSSCLTVKLPVEVVVNGISLTINDSSEFIEIEKILDASDTDTDVLEIVFPITIILADYEEEVVNNQEELLDLAEDCLEDGFDDDIECIDFKYPITFSTFDIENQLADVVTINTDEELHNFLENLDTALFVSLDFPVTMILFDGQEVEVNDNNELENLIESSSDDCDEDDDNDFDEDDVDDSELIATLIEGLWEVNYYFDEEDLTQDFEGFIFQFRPNNTTIVNKEGSIFEGEWQTFGDDGFLELDLEFDSEKPLGEIDREWDVLSFSNDTIRLAHIEDEEGVEVKRDLIFTKADESIEPVITVSDLIVEGEWIVALFVLDEEDLTTDFSGYQMNFIPDNSVSAFNGNISVSGTWEEIFDGEEHSLDLEFDSSDLFEQLNDEWRVVQFSEIRVELEDMSGSEIKDRLVLEIVE